MKSIRIATDYSRYPGGRFQVDGPYSGEEFRATFLVPALNRGEKLEIDLDGVRGYGSSFLEEAFGGLVRLGYAKSFINDHIVFRTESPSLRLEVTEYIDQAEAAAERRH